MKGEKLAINFPKNGIFVGKEIMNEEQLELLRLLQEKYGQEEGLKRFEAYNNFIMITIEQTIERANEKTNAKFDSLRAEMKHDRIELENKIVSLTSGQTKWMIGILITVLALLIKSFSK